MPKTPTKKKKELTKPELQAQLKAANAQVEEQRKEIAALNQAVTKLANGELPVAQQPPAPQLPPTPEPAPGAIIPQPPQPMAPPQPYPQAPQPGYPAQPYPPQVPQPQAPYVPQQPPVPYVGDGVHREPVPVKKADGSVVIELVPTNNPHEQAPVVPRVNPNAAHAHLSNKPMGPCEHCGKGPDDILHKS